MRRLALLAALPRRLRPGRVPGGEAEAGAHRRELNQLSFQVGSDQPPFSPNRLSARRSVRFSRSFKWPATMHGTVGNPNSMAASTLTTPWMILLSGSINAGLRIPISRSND